MLLLTFLLIMLLLTFLLYDVTVNFFTDNVTVNFLLYDSSKKKCYQILGNWYQF